jgi:acylphosphatase
MFRLTAYVSGRVQKVGYRARVIALAEDMSLAGFVQNLPDGRVEVVAEGRKNVLERFADALNIKNTFIDVKDIEAKYSEAAGGYKRFHKISTSGEVGDRLDEGIEILKEMSSGIKYLGNRMDMMLDKQDQALGKMDMMLDKQDQMLDKQDQMLDKQDDTIGEIKGLRQDLKGHMDRRFERIECELAEIKSALKERGII